ncbi:MAG: YkgJ family cysteine cluster protein [Bryobacteraceae bacterium]
MPDRESYDLEFTASGRTIQATVSIPKEDLRMTDLLPILFSFSNALVTLAEDVAKEAGKPVSCRAGCGACCRQLVPVSEPEALYIAELVQALPPDRAARVLERFRAALESLGAGLLERLRNAGGIKSLDERRELGLEYFRAGVPCPFLENESCSIHDLRPLSCREYLVSSPAENCKRPSAETIAMVPVPAKLSELLYCFGDGAGDDRTRWVPLVLALEWAESHAAEPPRWPAPKLFENFLRRVGPGGHEASD